LSNFVINPYLFVASDIYPDSFGSDGNIAETNCTINTSTKILGSGSLSFNGSSAYGDLGGSASDYGFLTQGFSLSLWLYPTEIAHKDVIFDNMDAEPSGNSGFYCRFNVASNKILSTISNGTTYTAVETSDVWTEDEWQLLTITYDGSTLTVYRNTVSVASVSATSNTNTPSFTPRLGWTADGNDNKYTGLIDDMVLFNNRVITSGEMSSLYNSGSGELVSTVFPPGDRSGLKAYYNMDSIDSNVVINNAIPTS